MLCIPRVAHAFWSSDNGLPFLRYISLASFALHNPDYRLQVYTHQDNLASGAIFSTHEQSLRETSDDFFPELAKIRNIDILEVDNTFIGLGAESNISAVHYSDILRLCLLAKNGGYWIDSDIIFTRSIASSFLGLPEFSSVDTVLSITSFGSSAPGVSNRIGFLGGCPSNSLFEELYLKSIQIIGNDYQQYGASLYNCLFPSISIARKRHPELDIMNLPNSALYLIHLTELLSGRLRLCEFMKSTHVLGCHWYGGGDSLKEVFSCFDGHPSRQNGMMRIRGKAGFIYELICYADLLAKGFTYS